MGSGQDEASGLIKTSATESEERREIEELSQAIRAWDYPPDHFRWEFARDNLAREIRQKYTALHQQTLKTKEEIEALLSHLSANVQSVGFAVNKLAPFEPERFPMGMIRHPKISKALNHLAQYLGEPNWMIYRVHNHGLSDAFERTLNEIFEQEK